MATRRCFSVLSAAAIALMCASCGNSNGMYPVKGKVLHKGAPAVGAMVSFIRKGGADAADEQVAQGIVQEDGTFTLAGVLGDGAAPGEYVVLVEWKEGAGKGRGRSPGLNAPDRLQKRYLDAQRPLLTATVEAKSNDLPAFNVE
jgi:hypothetical protein